MNPIDALRQTELFRDLDEHLLVALAARSLQRYLARGEVLFMMGNIAQGQYAVTLPVLAWFRAGIVTTLVMLTIRPYRRPLADTTLAFCVWTAFWLLVGGLWLVVVAPKFRIDFMHILFMGGFTLLILAVGTRVVLSHGGHALSEERRSWPLRIGLTTGLIALLSRLAAPFTPSSYYSHLAWAAVLWMAGILIWGRFLVRRIRPPSS